MRIGLRAGLIFAPLCGAVGLLVTLDALTALLWALGGGALAGVFFGVADRLGRGG